VQIDGGEQLRQFSTSAQTPQPYQNTKWNWKQAEDEDSGEDQKEQDANIRMQRAGQEDIVEPKATVASAVLVVVKAPASVTVFWPRK
jgi:hypothetical protein